MKYEVTIAIPTLNAEAFMKPLLEGIFSQKTKRKYEVLVVDSGSTDQTLNIIAAYPKVRLHQIPNKEFSHGPTRNLAASLAKGRYILFLTHDAIPAHKYWLEGMVEPFDISDKVACVVGKQVPWPDCPVTIKREVYMAFRSFGPDDAVILHRQNKMTEELKLVNTFMSNTNSAVRKDILHKIPFRNVSYAEDQGLGIDVLKAGYYKAYSPLGSVNHSHDYSINEYFRRKFDEYVGLFQTTGYRDQAGVRELVLGSLKATLKDWVFLARDKQYSPSQKLDNFFKAPLYNIGLRLAIRAANKDKGKGNSLEAELRSKAKQG